MTELEKFLQSTTDLAKGLNISISLVAVPEDGDVVGCSTYVYKGDIASMFSIIKGSNKNQDDMIKEIFTKITKEEQ
jgi:hypothetical protein